MEKLFYIFFAILIDVRLKIITGRGFAKPPPKQGRIIFKRLAKSMIAKNGV